MRCLAQIEYICWYAVHRCQKAKNAQCLCTVSPLGFLHVCLSQTLVIPAWPFLTLSVVCLYLQHTVTEKVCCGVMCTCTGQDGMRGPRGPPGPKVRSHLERFTWLGFSRVDRVHLPSKKGVNYKKKRYIVKCIWEVLVCTSLCFNVLHTSFFFIAQCIGSCL